MERFTTIFLPLLLVLSHSLFTRNITCIPLDAITPTRPMIDGDTVVSPGGRFVMGFFSPGNSGNRYVGIWYNNIFPRTVVWVANREAPVTNVNTSSVPAPTPAPARLKLIDPGILILLNGINHTVWLSSSPYASMSLDGRNPVAKLLDSGNLVVTGDEAGDPLWQSFDYLTDTCLPGMKFGKDLVTGKEWFLSSWKSDDDPAPGNYTWRFDTHGYPENILREGSTVRFRGGPWNGRGFSGGAALSSNSNPNIIFNYNMLINDKEMVYNYTLRNESVLSRFVLTSNGFMERWVWEEARKKWSPYFRLPKDDCDWFLVCGSYGSCNISNSPKCGCLDSTRFVPKQESDWGNGDWSGGCERRKPLNCANGTTDVFLKYSQIKLPDTRSAMANTSMDLEECGEVCLKNCSCMAYATLDIRNGGTGCLLWFDDLIDIRACPDGAAGQDIYVRMAHSELDFESRKRAFIKEHMKMILLVFVIVVVLIVLTLISFLYMRKRKNAQRREQGMSKHNYDQSRKSQKGDGDIELPLFDLSTIREATSSFSANNKLGEGGFGLVYKGMLKDGQEIAVKRLSKTSVQGIEEFKNEVICISKLQHRNLVKLLGCCIERDETLLIYEFMPNNSLDSFIFDKGQNSVLDWPKRFNIINGIARGLLYLHQDSRLRIIHRDLKASNILLDYEMNPKISDFGIARSFGGNETEASTQKVVGTYGYMSPEYLEDGVFSTKSDVYSFGVLVLEIVFGMRNKKFIYRDHHNNLLGHVWRLYIEGRPLELIEGVVTETCNLSEVLRAIQVGLLCVQESPEDRPSMSSVVFMLGSDGALPRPKHPGFFTSRKITRTEESSSTGQTSSVCEFSDNVSTDISSSKVEETSYHP